MQIYIFLLDCKYFSSLNKHLLVVTPQPLFRFFLNAIEMYCLYSTTSHVIPDYLNVYSLGRLKCNYKKRWRLHTQGPQTFFKVCM